MSRGWYAARFGPNWPWSQDGLSLKPGKPQPEALKRLHRRRAAQALANRFRLFPEVPEVKEKPWKPNRRFGAKLPGNKHG